MKQSKFRIAILDSREPNNVISDLETCEGTSQTIPGQSVPLNELVKRYQLGMPLPRINQNYVFQEDELKHEPDFDDAIIRSDVDITDVQSEFTYLRNKQKSAKRDVNDLVNSKVAPSAGNVIKSAVEQSVVEQSFGEQSRT